MNILARPPYLPPQAPAAYISGWIRAQLADLARAIAFQGTRLVFANDVVEATDDTILCDATAGALNIMLPLANQVGGLRVTIKKIDASANAVTLVGTIDGAVNPTLAAQYKSKTIQSGLVTANTWAWLTLATV